MIDRYLIVDGHVHTFVSLEVALKIREAFNKMYDVQFENSGTGAIDEVLKNMKENSIDYTVTANFASPKIIHRNNMWSLDMAKEHKNLVPLVSFHPDMEGNLPELLEEYIGLGAKGVKFHPMAQGFKPYHAALEALYRHCNELGFVMQFHCGRVSNARLNEYADLSMILPVIDKYPGIPFILTHMADGNVEDVLWLSKNYENVYFDTSIVITGHPSLIEYNEPSWLDDDMVVEVINTIGAGRVLFGSDYPWGSPKHDIDRILKLKLDDGQKSLILGRNSYQLFKIES